MEVATIIVGVVVAAAAALAPLAFLADLVSIGTLFAFIIVSGAVWILRMTDPATPRPFRAPWVPFVSTMGILVNGYMMFSLGRENWIRLAIWLVLGLLIYFGYSRHHSLLRRGGAPKRPCPNNAGGAVPSTRCGVCRMATLDEASRGDKGRATGCTHGTGHRVGRLGV